MGSLIRVALSAVAVMLLCAGIVTPAQTQVTQTTVWSFSGGNDGSGTFNPVIIDEKGALYGAEAFGGTQPPACFGEACGTVFKLTPPGYGQTPYLESTLWSFSGGSDGAAPNGLFARNEAPSPNKTLYGTTSGFSGAFGNGTVFRLKDGFLTTLWSFTGGDDGASPGTALAGDEAAGAIYGTTGAGGSGTCGCGTIFEIDPIHQTLTTIWTFASGGATGPVLVDKTGVLFGEAGVAGGGFGSVFQLTPPARGQTAWTLTTLYSFGGGSDGAVPANGLIADASGALYGTTIEGGVDSPPICDRLGGCGTVFKLTPPADGGTAWSKTALELLRR